MSKDDAWNVGSQFYVAEKLYASSAVNSMTNATLITGKLDRSRLERALRSVVENHDVMHGGFVSQGSQIDFVLRPVPNESLLELIDAPMDQTDIRSIVDGILQTISSERRPWRAAIIRHAPESHTFVLVAHRSIWDEFSTKRFGELLSTAYAQAGEDSVGRELSEGVERFESGFNVDDFDREDGARFFARTLDGVPPVHGFPLLNKRQRNQLSPTDTVRVNIAREFNVQIEGLSKDLRVSTFAVKVAAVSYVIAKYCSQSKVAIGLPFDQRTLSKRAEELGSLTAVLPMGIETDQASFAELCRHVDKLYSEGVTNSLTSVADVLAVTESKPDPAANALFQVAIVEGSSLQLQLDGCKCEPRSMPAPPQQIDLFLSCDRSGIRIDYSSLLIASGVVTDLAQSIETFLENALERPRDSLTGLVWISPEASAKVIEEFNRTKQSSFLEPDLSEVIRSGFEKNPDKTALICGDRSMTYRELQEAVDAAAALLMASGAAQEDLIGICMHRGIDMVVAVLAILRIGCAYVPLDPAFPRSRLEYMVDHAQLTRIVADDSLGFGREGTQILSLGNRDPEATASEVNLNPVVQRQAAAYVIYTSGSTGLPKGVVVPREAVTNFLLSMIEKPGLETDDVLCAVTTLSFDISVLELLAPLCVGATVVVATNEEGRDPRYLGKLLDHVGANILQATPATWQLLCASGWKGRSSLKAMCGGEALRPALAREVLERVGELWNMYGPTETTVWSTCKQIISADDPIAVGGPIHNTAVYVLDQDRRLVPQGVEGDIYIAGSGVTKGYLHNDELTRERFVPDPIAGGTMYNTGDRGRLDVNGELVVLGRSDFQVKIRGFRIELGDVEVALSHIPAVEGVVCVAQDTGSSYELVAFYTVRAGQNVESVELRKHCEAALPAHMIPSKFQQLDVLPKTPNGKVDRKALPKIEASMAASSPAARPAAPQDEMEHVVLEVFQHVLKSPDLTTQDSFFECGGNSLTAFSVVQEIESRTGIEVSVLRLFEFPTVSGLAAYLGGHSEANELVDDIVRRARLRRRALDYKTDVAIIGAAGRFPGARTLREFWDNLAQGIESVTFFDRDELDPLVREEDRADEAYIPARGVLEDAQMFDAEFFGITPNEAELMDPQLRIFMEVAWEAFEDAGYVGEDADGLVGVWGGMGNNFYYHHNVLTRPDKLAVMGEIAAEIANEKDHVAPRVSYKLNLTGPSLSVHSACSTGLVAIDMAYQALITHQVDYALAGAVDVRTPQKSGQLYEDGGVFSIDGHCRPFDADATGTMFGEGVGIVVLKRLEEALRDGDAIRAVIKGAATNHDGGEKGSYLSPSVEGQARVIATAMAMGDVNADTITFMEAHGTATPIGDPIEVESLTRVYRTQTEKKNYCALGSVKGNFGHATTAAGMAGLLKLTVSLEHKQIPATLHFKNPNPRIKFEDSPFFVNTDLIDWTRPEYAPRRGSTSSFGFCGTNAHVVVEEAPERPPSGPPSRPAHLMLVTGKTAMALKANASELGDALTGMAPNELADAAYTTHIGRKHFAHRRCAVVMDGEDTAEILRQTMGPRSMSVVADAKRVPVTFMFPGQGSQYINMGITLYKGESVFRAAVDHCAEELVPHLDCDLREFLFPQPGDENRATQSLNNTFYTQPAIFTISYALAQQLMHWGLKPDALIGHSIGEFVAATLAGVMSLSDALRLVATRGRLMKSLPEGSMLSVRLPADEVRDDLPPGIDLAAANGPQLCVVAGPTEDLQRYAGYLEDQDVKCRMLHTSHAFHSSMMDPVVKPFEEVVRSITLSEPQIPFVSTVTGDWITGEQATDPGYWAAHLRSPVLFAVAVPVLLEDVQRVMIECGPRRTLTTLALQQRPKRPGRIMGSMPESGEPEDEYVSLLMTAGSSWANGCEIDWQSFHEGEHRLRKSLPTYAFQRKRYWIEPGTVHIADSAVEVAAVRHSDDLGSEVTVSQEVGDPLMNSVVGLLEEALGGGIEDFDADAPFMMLGLDSLLLTQLARTLRVKLQFKVTFRQLTEQYSTPRLLVNAIREEQPDRFNQDATSAPAVQPATEESVAAEREVRPSAGGESEVELPLASPEASKVQQEAIDLESTPGQLEMWLSERADPASRCAFNEAFQIELTGPVNEAALLSALRMLPDFHPALRGTFSEDGERFVIRPNIDLTIMQHDLSSRSKSERDAEISRIAAEDSSTPYDLLRGPLFRAADIRLSSERHVVLLSAHHAACDGWSLDVLLADLGKIYRGIAEGQLPSRPKHTFADFVEYRSTQDYQEQIAASREFWAQTFEPMPPALALPHDGKRPARRTYAARHCLHEAQADTHRRIAEFARSRGLSFFSVLMAGYVALLHRLSGASDIVVGTPVAAHPEAGMEDCVGHMASMVPLRSSVEPMQSFEDLCRNVNSALLDAREHASVGFGEIIAQLSGSRDPSRVPLLAAVITHVQRYREDQLDFAGCQVDYHLSPRSAEVFELNINVVEAADSLTFKGHSNADLFSEEWLRWRLRELEQLLLEACANPDRAVGEIEMMPPAELEWVNHSVNPEPVPLTPDATLVDLLERQAQQTPDAIAVKQDVDSVSYKQLHREADRLAEMLRDRGARPGALVGICINRSIDMVRAVLAVLKCGAAYVPLDPAFPQNRISYMIEHAGIGLIVSEKALQEVHRLPESSVLNLDDVRVKLSEPLQSSVQIDNERPGSETPAYVLYTSGSTGKPKGVVVPHRAAVNFLQSMAKTPGLSNQDRLLAVTTLSFDISVLELLLPLSVGASVIVATKDQTLDGQALMQLIEQEQITVMQATPITWRLLIEARWKGGENFKALCGGEAMPSDLASALIERTSELWNMYGPTETTVWSTCCRVSDSSRITVGRPIANTIVRVLDEQMRPCPIGVPGEIHIGGAGVSFGYLNRPDLTEERFVEDPLSTHNRALLYKTGDLGKWLPSGELDCLGRNDSQIKLRGFRIELGEIEAAISSHPDVQEAAAQVQSDGDNQQLVGYVVLRTGIQDIPQDLQAHMSEFLPRYMIPSTMMVLPALPQTANGKIDRKSLPPPANESIVATVDATIASRNDIEAKVREVFIQHLHMPSLGLRDDFFDVGGHSLLAVRTVNDINEAFGTEISVASLFADPTVEGMAKAVVAGDGKLADAVIQIHDAGKERPPFFFICGIALYQPLALNMGSTLSSYGIYIPQEEEFFARQDSDEPLTVPDLAKQYADAILAHPASASAGSCYLGGVSFGGLLAFEVARQLQAVNDFDVENLVLLDTVLPGALTRNVRAMLAHHMKKTHEGGISYLSDRILKRLEQPRSGPKKVGKAKQAESNNERLWRALNGRAVQMYLNSSPNYSGSTLIVRAMDRSSHVGFDVSIDLGWQNFLTNSARIVDAPGDHLGILRDKCTAELILNDVLGEGMLAKTN